MNFEPSVIFDWFVPYLYPCEYKSLGGGRSSGKSNQMAILAILRMAQRLSNPAHIGTSHPYYPPGPVTIMSARQYNVTLPRSVKSVIENWIYTLGLEREFRITKSEIFHPASRSECFFEGIDRNVRNVLSYDSIAIWWFEQAEFLTDDQMRLILPTARHQVKCPITGKIYRNEKWFVWNPQSRTDWVWKRFIDRRKESDLHLHVNYQSNPVLPENMHELADDDRRDYPAMFNHIWLGAPNDTDAHTQILPYAAIKACVDAWDKRPQGVSSWWRTDAGLDIALGGEDKCSLVTRTGPVVHDIKTWKGLPNLNEIAREGNRILEETCSRNNTEPTRLYYDAAHPMEGAYDEVGDICATEGVLFGGAVSSKDEIWERRHYQRRYVRPPQYSDGDRPTPTRGANEEVAGWRGCRPPSVPVPESRHRKHRPRDRIAVAADPPHQSGGAVGNGQARGRRSGEVARRIRCAMFGVRPRFRVRATGA